MLLVCFFLFSRVSFSQPPHSSPIIQEISVEIRGQQEAENLAALIAVKEGETYSLRKISQSIKQLFKTGLFSDIQVIREGYEKVHLRYVLTRRYFTKKIEFLTEEEISRKELKKAVASIREGSPFSEGMLRRAEEEVREELEREGYFDPEIRTHVKRELESSSVDVLFEIRSPKRYVIQEIKFAGQLILSESQLRERMKSKEGRAYVPSELEKDIVELKKLYHDRGFNQAEVKIERRHFEEDRVSIIMRVIPHERFEIVVRGADVPLDLLLPIWEERVFEEWGLSEGEAKIIGYLRKKGYIFASVRSFIEREDHRIRVVYEVTPGKKYAIQDICFEGLQFFTSAQLRKELGIRERIPFLSWISGERLFELPQEIKALYQRNGFSQASVDLNFNRVEDKVTGVYYIEEGPQDRIQNISFRGTALFTSEELLGQINSYPGGPYFRPKIDRDVERLENFYLEEAVRGTEIKPAVEKVAENLYSVLFEIHEGKRVSVERIIIAGNRVTKKSTILRELRIREGDDARYGLIRESKRRLENLGLFTEIKIEEVPISPEKENLIISLREGERNYVSLGVGLETKSEPRALAVWNNVVRVRGTAELIRSNIFGRGAQLSLVGQISLKEKRGVISWEQPYFFGIPLQTYLNAWLEREERKSFSFERRGVSLTSMKPFSENAILLTTLRWARTTLMDLQISESEIDRQYSPFSASSLSGSFIWDRRDDPFNPRRGYFFSFVLEWAYPLFKAESDFLKNFIKYQHYVPLLPNVIFSSTFRLGLGRGRMPIHERFFAGGSNSFRGEEFDELGPRDPQSLKPVGGKALFLLNFELTFPLLSSFRDLFGTFFYDIGNVFGKRRQLSLASLRNAIGAGLRYRTPLGPIRFEVGWNLDAPEEEKKVLAFITIGNVF